MIDLSGSRLAGFVTYAVFSVLSLTGTSAAETLWINSGSGNWSDGNNWDLGSPPNGNGARIDNGGTAVVGNGQSFSPGNITIGSTGGGGAVQVNIGSLAAAAVNVGVDNVGSLVINGGNVSSNTMSIGIGSLGNGNVTIDNNGLLSSQQYLNIGATGIGTLILNSGTVQAGYNWSVRIGEQSGSTGNVIVKGGILRGSIGEDNFVVGRSGTGTLEVNNNGIVTSSWMFVGGEYRNTPTPTSQGGVGNITLNNNSRLENTAGIVIGGKGSTGAITINDSALMQTDQTLYLGYEASGSLTMNGGQVVSKGSTIVGVNGGSYGTLSIHNQGIVSSGSGTIASAAGSVGSVSVIGSGSAWNAANLAIGLRGTGSLEIIQSGSVTNNAGMIGYGANSIGVVTVSGNGSTWTNTGSLTVGEGGSGTLTISDQGAVKTESISLASLAGSVGTLNIGAGGRAGVLETPSISGLSGQAIINFDHIDSISFAPQMTGELAVNHINAGTTTLAASNDYNGVTTIRSGILKAGAENTFSPNSQHIVADGGTLDLNGFNQTVADLTNGGAVRINGAPGTILNVAGSYVGDGGRIDINTILDADSSATDKLVVAGDTAGNTNVRVTNIGGTGAQTTEGIEVISVGGISNGVFTLLGDYTTLDNKAAVIAGAYAYTLEKNGVSTPTDGNWYLRSQMKPVEPEPDTDPEPEPQPEPGPDAPRYQAGAPVYETYPQSLLALNGVSTLQQRVGNRVWAGNGNKVIVQGADAIETPYAAPEEAGVHIEGNGVWGRVEGAHNHIETGRSTTDVDYDQNIFKLQAGVDGMFMENESGKLIGGVSVHYAHGLTKTASIYDTSVGGGRISTEGYGLGGSLTWYGKSGFYVDAQAQATWYNSDLSFSGGNQSLVDGNDGFGYALSIESGKRLALDPAWSLTPQAQLVYSSVDFDDFSEDMTGTAIHLSKGDSLQGRIGLTLDHESSWQNANGMLNRAHVYGIANLYYEFLEGTRVEVADVSFANRNDRAWGGIGLGGSYNWNDDKYSIYGEGLINTSLNNFADSYSLKGNVGFRVKW